MSRTLDELIAHAQDLTRYERVPGLFRPWELEAVVVAGFEYRVEEAGTDASGCRLFALYRRACPTEELLP